MELDATVYAFLEHTLHFVVEAREAIEGLLKGEEVIEHRLCLVVPSLAWDHNADSGRIDQRESRRDPALERLQGT